ncbi:hypothetical protein [Alkalicoccus saliphilus]|uniref:hypothetical protein n=1 Tax=Alkalicoccus saliphilus TaxID=200989 RepID=UPI001C3FC416|nr:hypothetical protein [Alkalicoccus saliphilus]
MDDFLIQNHAEKTFNQKQRIILVASDYDEQTLSTVAWLSQNGIDISCYKLIPYLINNDVYIQVDKLIPSVEYEDYYVNLEVKHTNSSGSSPAKTKDKEKVTSKNSNNAGVGCRKIWGYYSGKRESG